jgi:hypothetical protein
MDTVGRLWRPKRRPPGVVYALFICHDPRPGQLESFHSNFEVDLCFTFDTVTAHLQSYPQVCGNLAFLPSWFPCSQTVKELLAPMLWVGA